MNWLLLIIFLTLFACSYSAYNPIPIGSVIISTISKIVIMKPAEYGGTNELTTIYTATTNMTIINTVYDPSYRNLYIIFTDSTNNNTVYSCQLLAVEQLDSKTYELPISFNPSNVNQLNSFTSDVINRRVFLTNSAGTITLFSMGGLMETTITAPTNTSETIRSASYSISLNKLFVITDTKVYACSNFDNEDFQCCEGVARGNRLRSIEFDQVLSDTYVYVLDEQSGIYRVTFDTNGCPTSLNPINTLGTYRNLHFAIDRGLYFASGSAQNGNDNSLIVIANGTQNPRSLPIGSSIVALHISNPNTNAVLSTEETCFHGITYSDYRVAVILAALFGTIMGIFMCFNVLFCIDFVMTKRIIRNLKQQIPHNLLEDRWNKLVEEKYAKIALEKQRRKDDPPPKRRSSVSARKTTPATTTEANTTNQNSGGGDSLQIPNPIPKLSAYLRRKSESYISRRRSDDYRTQRNQTIVEIPESKPRTPRSQTMVPPQIHIESVQEENENQRGLRENFSGQQLIKDDDFL